MSDEFKKYSEGFISAAQLRKLYTMPSSRLLQLLRHAVMKARWEGNKALIFFDLTALNYREDIASEEIV